MSDALAKLSAVNIDLITNVKVAKTFLNIGNAIIRFDGKDKSKSPFQLRIDYDPVKGAHVNLVINGERHAYMFPDNRVNKANPKLGSGNMNWFSQVVNTINGGQYCDVPKDPKSPMQWNAAGGERNARYIRGMKSCMKGYLR